MAYVVDTFADFDSASVYTTVDADSADLVASHKLTLPQTAYS